MATLRPTDVQDEVLVVLDLAARRSDLEAPYVSVHQILKRLPWDVLNVLIEEGARGIVDGDERPLTPAELVARAGDILVQKGLAEKTLLDIEGLVHVEHDEEPPEPVCPGYRAVR